MPSQYARLTAQRPERGVATADAPPVQRQQTPFLNIIGTYGSDTLWRYRLLYIRDTPGQPRVDDFSCPGTITITDQDFEKFAGTFTQSAPCPVVSGTLSGGSRLVPQVRFTMRAGRDFGETMDRMTGCSAWGGAHELFGTIVPTGSGLQARVSGAVNCQGARVLATFEISSFTQPKPTPKRKSKTKRRA